MTPCSKIPGAGGTRAPPLSISTNSFLPRAGVAGLWYKYPECAFRPEAVMDYPEYLRAQAAGFRAKAREVDEAAAARELQELAVVCEHVADELEDRQTAG